LIMVIRDSLTANPSLEHRWTKWQSRIPEKP
jgi:hypothetical protein